MIIRTTVEADLDRILTCLQTPSVNTATPERYTDFLESGAYRHDRTWIAEDGGQILALAVWWGFPTVDRPLVLDALYADPSVADPVPLWTELVARVVESIGPGDEQPEYHVFMPPDWRSDPEIVAQIHPRLEAAANAGLSDPIERLRFEWTGGLPPRSTRLTFLPEPDDEAFIEVFARVVEGSLDVGTARAVVRVGVEQAAREQLGIYRSMPGKRDWWRLAYDDAGEMVGFALPSANSGGPVVGYLGVFPEHRGHGYVNDLLSEITHLLAEDGAERIGADTDLTNEPMAAAFRRAGYHVYGIRLVAGRPGA